MSEDDESDDNNQQGKRSKKQDKPTSTCFLCDFKTRASNCLTLLRQDINDSHADEIKSLKLSQLSVVVAFCVPLTPKRKTYEVMFAENRLKIRNHRLNRAKIMILYPPSVHLLLSQMKRMNRTIQMALTTLIMSRISQEQKRSL